MPENDNKEQTRAVEPGTAEHVLWCLEQAHKREAWEREFIRTRPPLYRCREGGVRAVGS